MKILSESKKIVTGNGEDNIDMPLPKCLRVDQWPGIIRDKWEAGLAPTDLLESDRPFICLSTDSILSTQKSVGRFISFLLETESYEMGDSLSAYVSVDVIKAYIRALRDHGNANSTIANRLMGLERGLRIMEPGQDCSFLLKPFGKPVRSCIVPKSNPVLFDSRELFDLGLNIMQATPNPRNEAGAIMYRNGLTIAMLAARARRRRAMLGLKINGNIFRAAETYLVCLERALIKTRKTDRFELPQELVAYIDKYLGETRPVLLRGQLHDWFWVSRQGNQLSANAMLEQVRKITKEHLGVAVNIHSFRHCYVTSAALSAPSYPELGAAGLGITGAVAERHYDRAAAVGVVMRFERALARRRLGIR